MPVFPRFPVHCGSLNMFNKVWSFANGSATSYAAKLWQGDRNPSPIFSGLYVGHSAADADWWWLLCLNSISTNEPLIPAHCEMRWYGGGTAEWYDLFSRVTKKIYSNLLKANISSVLQNHHRMAQNGRDLKLPLVPYLLLWITKSDTKPGCPTWPWTPCVT